jgi:uncharacterized protein YndB with AHSA1/START domain
MPDNLEEKLDMPTTATEARDREISIARTLNAPPTRVFELWTRPENLARWWGPRDDEGRDFTVPHVTFDARPGGHWRICMRAPDGTDHWHRGVFREVEAPRRLVFTHAFEEGDGRLGEETVISVDFEDLGRRTRMRFHQTPVATRAAAESQHEGWTQCFDRLEELIGNT